MKPLEDLIRLKKNIRVAGFDDAPFEKERGSTVHLSGIICSNTRFEGMLWGEVIKDGTNATQVVSEMLLKSKFYQQVNVVLTDGITLGGFNLINLPELARRVDRPCISVMRKAPDYNRIESALRNFDDFEDRWKTVQQAGEVCCHGSFFYQVAGCSPEVAAEVLNLLTDTGNVPEALRIAHLIGSAIKTGQSSNSA